MFRWIIGSIIISLATLVLFPSILKLGKAIARYLGIALAPKKALDEKVEDND